MNTYFVSYVERKCREHGIPENLAALIQLRKAVEQKNEEDACRIAQNILSFIEKREKKTIPNLKRQG